jgi:hypothetical protein
MTLCPANSSHRPGKKSKTTKIRSTKKAIRGPSISAPLRTRILFYLRPHPPKEMNQVFPPSKAEGHFSILLLRGSGNQGKCVSVRCRISEGRPLPSVDRSKHFRRDWNLPSPRNQGAPVSAQNVFVTGVPLRTTSCRNDNVPMMASGR